MARTVERRILLLRTDRHMEFVKAFALVLAQIAPFLLLGFFVAGILHAFVPRSLLARAMGGTGIGPIIRAALVGIPLPLCSCSVIPVAVEIKNRGAGRGATTAFLVSTPETGVDSISTSVAVLHPLMVIFRPLAAMATAVVAGLAVERFSAEPPNAAGADGGCCHHAADEAESARGLLDGMRYAFGDLFAEISVYLVPAILITAVLTTLIVPLELAGSIGPSWLQMLILLVAGIPVYVCATAATPIAAALIVSGFSPGAALVFLLAGPATNLVTITTVAKTLGKRGAWIYVLSVGLVSLVFGVALDLLFSVFKIEPAAAAISTHEHVGLLAWVSAILLTGLIVWHLALRIRKRAAR